MHYRLLRKIVAQVLEMSCPRCQGRYTMDDVDIFDLYEDDGILELHCRTCQSKTSVEVNVVKKELAQTTENTPALTPEDVERVRKKIRQHKGSIGKLFNR